MNWHPQDHPRVFADDSAEHAVTILRWSFNIGIALVIGLGTIALLAK